MASLGGSLEPSSTNRIQAGVEYGFHENLFLRAGYQLDLGPQGFEQSRGFAAGVGYIWRDLSLDYAYQPFGMLGDSHMASLGYSFGPRPDISPSTPPLRTAPKSSILSEDTDALPATPERPNRVPSERQASKAASPDTAMPEGSRGSVSADFWFPPDPFFKARELEKRGYYEEAVKVFADAIKQDNRDTMAWWGLGNLCMRLKKKEHAIKCFDAVLRLKPQEQKLKEWLEEYKAKPVRQTGNPSP